CPAGRLVLGSAAPRLLHDSLGLIPVRGGDLAVARKRLVRAERGLGVARAVRSDLGRARALQASRFKMLADLPAARTARLEVLAGIAADLRGTVLSGVDLVAEPPQPPGQLRLIHGGRELLTAVELLGLERAGPSVGGLGHV